jgi:hypothetical protein
VAEAAVDEESEDIAVQVDALRDQVDQPEHLPRKMGTVLQNLRPIK